MNEPLQRLANAITTYLGSSTESVEFIETLKSPTKELILAACDAEEDLLRVIKKGAARGDGTPP